MRHSYDAHADALYITLAEGDVARTVDLGCDDRVMADEDADGNLIGIEVLSPSLGWPLAAVLRRWDVSEGDAAMLIAGYPFAPVVKIARK